MIKYLSIKISYISRNNLISLTMLLILLSISKNLTDLIVFILLFMISDFEFITLFQKKKNNKQTFFYCKRTHKFTSLQFYILF